MKTNQTEILIFISTDTKVSSLRSINTILDDFWFCKLQGAALRKTGFSCPSKPLFL